MQKFDPNGALIASRRSHGVLGGLPFPGVGPFAVDSTLGLLYVAVAYTPAQSGWPGGYVVVLKYDLSLNPTGSKELDLKAGMDTVWSATFDSAHRFCLVNKPYSVVYKTFGGSIFSWDSSLNESSQQEVHYVTNVEDYSIFGGLCADSNGARYLFWLPENVGGDFGQWGPSPQIVKSNSTGQVLTQIILPDDAKPGSSCSLACDPGGRLYVLTTNFEDWYYTTSNFHHAPWKVSRYVPVQ